MSTRGVIARRQGDGFVGRYHHWDSDPEGLGKALWNLAQGYFQGNLAEMLHVLIDEHPAGWSTIVDKNFTARPGFNELNSAICTRCGKPSWEHYYQEWEYHGKRLTVKARQEMSMHHYAALGHAVEYPRASNPECYCHGDRHEGEQLITEANAASCGCEYAYVFSFGTRHRDKPANRMAILSSCNPDGGKMIGLFGRGNPEAIWQVLAVVDLNGPEPDWSLIGK